MAKKTNGKTQNRDFNLTIGSLKFSERGNLTSKAIDKNMMDVIQQIEPGGKFFIKFMEGDDGRYAYLEYMSKDKVSAFKASREASSEDTV